jgi:hypothetical protein
MLAVKKIMEPDPTYYGVPPVFPARLNARFVCELLTQVSNLMPLKSRF